MIARTGFKLHRVKQLANDFDCSVDELSLALNQIEHSPSKYFRELVLIDPAGLKKDRDVIAVRGQLRQLQERLLARRLRHDLPSSLHSHGSVGGRSIVSNALVHRGSRYVYATDIAAFYPSISYDRVYRFFVDIGYAPGVARVCTRLCTYRHHLALGLVTSPIIANAIFHDVDERIAQLCRSMGMKYSRYVDDLLLSGNFDLARSGVGTTIANILRQNGFRIREDKNQYGDIERDVIVVAGVRLKRTSIDANPSFIRQLEGALEEARALADHGTLPSCYLTRDQLYGKVNFAIWLNPGRKRRLTRLFQSVNWKRHFENAKSLGLVRVVPFLADRATRQPISA